MYSSIGSRVSVFVDIRSADSPSRPWYIIEGLDRPEGCGEAAPKRWHPCLDGKAQEETDHAQHFAQTLSIGL